MSAASEVPEATPAPGSISAFFPAYHDWGTIASQVLLVSRTLRELTDDWEVIVVDDGSRDRTPEVLDELAKVCPRLRVVTHPKNRGYGGALRSGFAAARKEWVFYTDGDAQYDVCELSLLWAAREGADMVNGFKIARHDPAHRIIIGHCCGTSDHEYHMKIVRGGSYLGFDRFGLDVIHPDTERVASLLKLIKRGATSRVVVSHDSVWCWRGEPIADRKLLAEMEKVWTPSHFCRHIVPRLLDGGATKDDIDTLLVANPRRFFAGDPLPAISG